MSHPFENANRCELAEVSEVVPSPQHPDGLKWGAPCRCPRFLTLMHDVQEPGPTGRDGKPTTVTVRTAVQGCFYRLYPWMQGGAITQTNAVLGEVVAARAETQAVGEAVTWLGELRAQLHQGAAPIRTIEATHQTPLAIVGEA